jgi:hypothetical protein
VHCLETCVENNAMLLYETKPPPGIFSVTMKIEKPPCCLL